MGSRIMRLWHFAFLALLLAPIGPAFGADSDRVPFIAVPGPDTGAATVPVPGGPGQGNVVNPSLLSPAPNSLSNTQQLQLKAYRDQLNAQQRDLLIQQSHAPLTPNQQQRLYQTQQESNRVNRMLTPAPAPAFTLPSPGLRVGPPPLIPTH
jgi:hypothetical protein